MTKKKSAFGILSLFLGFGLLTSCQGGGSDSTTGPSSTTTPPNSSETTSNPSSTTNPSTSGSSTSSPQDPLIKDPKGQLSDINKLRASQGQSGMPSLGQVNVLVVPVQFHLGADATEEESQFAFTKDITDNVHSSFFGEANAIPSVKAFYEESSNGKLTIGGATAPVVELSDTLEEAMTIVSSQGAGTYFGSIVDTVYSTLFEGEDKVYDLSDFDSDDDGKVDSLVLVNPLPTLILLGGNSTGDENIDALLSDVVAFGTEESHIDSFAWTSAFCAEYNNYMQTYSASGPDSHFYVNIIGSMMGLDTYYDLTGNSTTNTYRAPLAMLDRMDGYIGDHNPFSKYQLGWAEPTYITPNDVGEKGKTITISKGESIALSYENQGLYGEYLLLDLYTPEGLNAVDSENAYVYGRREFTTSGVRVYEVNSSLVRGRGNQYVPYDGEPDYDATYTLSDGTKAKYSYAYAHSNSSINPLSEYGVIDPEPLVSLLSSTGMNRHIVDFNNKLGNDDLFAEGSSFSDSGIPGFYQDFRFDSGKELGLTFSVDKIEGEQVTLTIRRA